MSQSPLSATRREAAKQQCHSADCQFEPPGRTACRHHAAYKITALSKICCAQTQQRHYNLLCDLAGVYRSQRASSTAAQSGVADYINLKMTKAGFAQLEAQLEAESAAESDVKCAL